MNGIDDDGGRGRDRFSRGAFLVLNGIKTFYADAKAWKYAAVPMAAMFVLTAVFVWGGIHFGKLFSLKIEEWTNGMPSELDVLWGAIGSIAFALTLFFAILFAISLLSTVYEIFGGFFFDYLIEYYEKKKYHQSPVPKGFSRNAAFVFDSIRYGCGSVFIFIGMFLLSWFIPVAGQLLLFAVMGYRLAVSYLMSTGFFHNLRLNELRIILKKQAFWSVLGFGITSYLLLLIPFATILFLPGLVLGGTMLCEEILSAGQNKKR